MELLHGLLDLCIELDEEDTLLYGSDQAYIYYPCVFATVNIKLLSTDMLEQIVDLMRLREGLPLRGEDSWYDFYIELNDYNSPKIATCIECVLCDDNSEETYYIDLDQNTQYALYKVLDHKCFITYGKGCATLLAEAREAMKED